MINTLCVATNGFYSGDSLAIATRGFICDGAIIEYPVEFPISDGPSNYGYEDELKRIAREDEEVFEFIKMILTKGLL